MRAGAPPLQVLLHHAACSTVCVPLYTRVQELDEARASSKALRDENTQLVNDNAHLKQQLDSRSQHCMTLIGENKRLLGQVRAAGQAKPHMADASPLSDSTPWVACWSTTTGEEAANDDEVLLMFLQLRPGVRAAHAAAEAAG